MKCEERVLLDYQPRDCELMRGHERKPGHRRHHGHGFVWHHVGEAKVKAEPCLAKPCTPCARPA